MRIEVNSIEELIKSSYNSELFSEIYFIISKCMGDKGTLFTSNSKMSMIGYKYTDYKDGKWPLVSIAPQKNNISVYVFAVEDGKYVVEKYAGEFGKSNIGKSCIRIKKMTPKRKEVLEEILKKV